MIYYIWQQRIGRDDYRLQDYGVFLPSNRLPISLANWISLVFSIARYVNEVICKYNY